MMIREMRRSLEDTQTDFFRRYPIPFRTIRNWETEVNAPPAYAEELLNVKQRRTSLTAGSFRCRNGVLSNSSFRKTIRI